MSTATTTQIDQIMESATQALMEMDYAASEKQCLEALSRARAQGLWHVYARVVLPLQEARRQRRMTAADGVIRLGSASLAGTPSDWAQHMSDGGCLVLTHPHTAADAGALRGLLIEQGLPVEVLWADCGVDAQTWTVRSFSDNTLAVDLPAPPAAWRDTWLGPGQSTPPAQTGGTTPTPSGATRAAMQTSATPADWMMDAMEALGDRALALCQQTEDPARRLTQLEASITAAPDHELLHQHLADTARRLHRATPA